MLKQLALVLILLFATKSSQASVINVPVKRAQQARAQIFLNEKNTVTLRGPIDDASTLEVMLKLASAQAKRGSDNYPIYLVLDSPGGSIDAGDTLIQYAKTIRNLHTITIFSASMAAGIVEALPGYRYITENGMLMFHRATVGLQGQVENGEVESRLDMIKKIVRRMEIKNSGRMQLGLDDYKKAVKDELWLNYQDSVAWKAADQVVDLKCSQELINEKESITLSVLFFTFKLQFSGCPLFRNPMPMEKKEDQAAFIKLETQIREKLRGINRQGVLSNE